MASQRAPQRVHIRHSKYGKPFSAGKARYIGMNYKQLKRKHNIAPLADDDGDGVPNKYDCRPWDKHKQDIPKDPAGDLKKRADANEARIEIRQYFEEIGEQLAYDFDDWSDDKVIWYWNHIKWRPGKGVYRGY